MLFRPARPGPPAPAAKKSLDDVSTDDIDSWLVGPNSPSNADLPTAVYGGDTITISAFKDAAARPSHRRRHLPATTNTSASPTTSTKQDEPYDDGNDDDDETIEDGAAATVAEVPEEFMDESNPFYAAKKAQKLQSQQGPAGPAKEAFKDTSDAAGDILRRLMERRRAEKSS